MSHTLRRHRRLVRAAGVLTSVCGLAALSLPTHSAQAASTPRVDLQVLVVTNGDSNTGAIAAELTREGVPYTTLDLGSATRPVITDSFLADASTHEAKFQAVVLPNEAPAALSAAEQASLASYEAAYAIPQVDAFVYPGGQFGFTAPSYSGTLDGDTAAVAAAGLSGPFSYLKGPVPIDNFDPATSEVYGYLAAVPATMPAGTAYTALINDTHAGVTGPLVGEYDHNGRQELLVSAAFNSSQQWFDVIAHGIVTWMTRGVHLGYTRNYFAVQVDDIFLPDSRWSSTSHCTPGDGFCPDGTVTNDIRMSPQDVTNLVAWQKANGFSLDMVFNGGGGGIWAENPQAPAGTTAANDPLTAAFTKAGTENQFTWMNHTWTHEFLGCIQDAPTTAGALWTCSTKPACNVAGSPAAPNCDPGPFFDEDLTQFEQKGADGFYYLNAAEIQSQINQNITFGTTTHKFTNFNPHEIVTGEHSGLLVNPEQVNDNPFLQPAEAASGVTYTASDASRETASRQLGTGAGAVTTVPRHPMNIFYNAGTYADEVNEYNWLYATPAAGGNCSNTSTTTCMTTALPEGTQAQTSFTNYIQPIEVRNALNAILSNDPRPFYAHQSNLAGKTNVTTSCGLFCTKTTTATTSGDAILLPVVAKILSSYNALYATSSPIVHTNLAGQGLALTRMAGWTNAEAGTTAYLDASGVHVQGSTSAVPLTVPASSGAAGGVTLESYAGEKSGWFPAPATDTVVATPPNAYVPQTAPGAPGIGTAVAGDSAATVAWTAPTTGGAAITSYTVNAYTAGSTTPATSLVVTAPATSATVTGLTNGLAYTFDVSATNAIGTSPLSARSNAVTPHAPTVPAAPTLGTVKAGNASLTLAWTAPADNGGSAITGYTVNVYAGTALAKTQAAAATATTASVTGLTNGTGYTVEVVATNAIGAGPASARSAVVTPGTIPGAPVIGTAVAGTNGGTVTAKAVWAAPASNGGSPITSYTVTATPTGLIGVLGGARTVTATAAGTATSLDVTLTKNVSYQFTVKATNAFGTGATSGKSNTVVAR